MDPATLRIAVILLSYNRPKMLEIAYQSILPSLAPHDAIILVDDASEAFDALDWRADHPRINCVIMGPARSLDERMNRPVLGGLINQALDVATWPRAKEADGTVVRLPAKLYDVVTYLCDDDLFHPDWLPGLRKAFALPIAPHVVAGVWRSFKDPLKGDPIAVPPKRTPRARMDWRQLTTGNFAHLTACYRDEGLRWDETKIAVHDDTFTWNLHEIHPINRIFRLDTTAGWRRLHHYNMANWTQHSDYGAGAGAILARGALE
jgi:glycosyltransferase involved in cell wall biosynthesis